MEIKVLILGLMISFESYFSDNLFLPEAKCPWRLDKRAKVRSEINKDKFSMIYSMGFQSAISDNIHCIVCYPLFYEVFFQSKFVYDIFCT